MPENGGQERTEDATPRRRQQARKKGTVARSHDLTSALVAFALAIVLPAMLSNLGESFMVALRSGIQGAPTQLSADRVFGYGFQVASGPILALAPIVLVAMGVGIAANFGQVGFVLSGEAMAPSFNKINPMKGLQRMFSRVALMEGAKASGKSVLFGYLVYVTIRANWGSISGLGWLPVSAALALIGSVLKQVLFKIVAVWLALACLDYFFQKKQVDQQLKMTKEELKQEMKEMEQSPELRSAIARRRAKLSRRMMQAVKSADVVITNPTHYAVALKYEPGKMHAPQVVAKGMDLLAAKIREVAKESRVPIVPNPPLTRQIYKKCEVGDFVPRDLFQAVAEVLAFVYKAIRDVRAA